MIAVLQQWLDRLTLDKSAATQTGYAWEIKHFLAAFPDKQPADFAEADLLHYLAARRATCGDATIRRSVNALRSFFRFAGSEAAARIPLPHPKLHVQRTLTHAQAFAMLAACDTSAPRGLRDLALVSLMLDSGLRASEVCRLQVDQLDLAAQLLHVMVKGGQEEFGVYSEETASTLAAWLATRERIARCANVFVGFEGHRIGQPLTPDGLRCIFRAIGKRAGLPHFSPHDLRRTFATLTTLMGAPSRLVQKAGRWHDLSLVDRYTQALRAQDIAAYLPVHGLMRLLDT